MIYNNHKTFIYALAAGGISLLAHLLVIAFANQITLDSLPPITKQEKGKSPIKRQMELKQINIREQAYESRQDQEETISRESAKELAARMKKRTDVKEILQTEGLLEPLKSLETPNKTPAPDSSLPEDPPEVETEETLPKPPRPEILDIQADKIPQERLTESRRYIADQQRSDIDKNLLNSLLGTSGKRQRTADTDSGMTGTAQKGTPSPPGLDEILATEMLETETDQTSSDKDENETKKQRGTKTTEEESPDDQDAPSILETADKTTDKETATTDAEKEKVNPLDKFVDTSMKIYSAEDGKRYFRIDISPNNRSDSMRSIDKDTLILIDCSMSISPAQMAIFKKTAERALAYLNRNDRFNVVSFRTKTFPLFDSYQPVNSINIEKARNYVQRLRRSGKTDVYAGLAPYVGAKGANSKRPLTIFMFSDGQSTVADKLDDQTLLKRIHEANREQVSIYSASSGAETNRYVLDLLAYTNQGRPLFKREINEFRKAVVDYIKNHASIILTDLNYDATGKVAEEMYPKKLPHLYRSSTLSIYGRLPEDISTFGVRITGNNQQKELLDYVFKPQVDKAQVTSENLKKDWISQKAYFLIAKEAIQPGPEVKAELKEFRQQYDLDAPYF